jgi:hypothetical protein
MAFKLPSCEASQKGSTVGISFSQSSPGAINQAMCQSSSDKACKKQFPGAAAALNKQQQCYSKYSGIGSGVAMLAGRNLAIQPDARLSNTTTIFHSH